VAADRLTRLDRIMIAERGNEGLVDLPPRDGQSYLVRENRHHLIDRVKRLERFLARQTEPGCWYVSERTEEILKALGARTDIVNTVHRALSDHGLAVARDVDSMSSTVRAGSAG
jgi:hypothetical protein